MGRPPFLTPEQREESRIRQNKKRSLRSREKLKAKRAARAIAEGREPGKVGQPRVLTDEQRAANRDETFRKYREANQDKIRERDAKLHQRRRAERAVSEGTQARDAFVARMAAYVLDVDRLVYLIEHDLDRRIQTLRLIQGTALFAIIVVMFISLYLMHAQVIVPLADLLQCARRVRSGDFTVRAQHAGEDELGQLGQSFNYMVADLSRSYATLEAKVEEKTEQLARSNVSLEVLYRPPLLYLFKPLGRNTLVLRCSTWKEA